MRAIVPHAFGDHSSCGISWCKYRKDPVGYKHMTLPHGRDLEGEERKKDLMQVIEIYCQNAEKLAPLGSSQDNEALNNTIGSKAPKIRHYGSSESNDYRVACAVGQKNIGHCYVTQVSNMAKHYFLFSVRQTESYKNTENIHTISQVSNHCSFCIALFCKDKWLHVYIDFVMSRNQ